MDRPDRKKSSGLPRDAHAATEDAASLLKRALGDEASRREALTGLSALARTRQGRQGVEDAVSAVGRDALHALLKVPDPKSRKNAAILLGTLADARDLGALSGAHASETMGYVRASMLLALGRMGADVLAYLSCISLDESSPSFKEERHALHTALSRFRSVHHAFVSLGGTRDIVLRTLPAFERDLYLEAVRLGFSADITGPGEVTLSTADYAGLFTMRAFSEALFPLGLSVAADGGSIAHALQQADLAGMLRVMHASPGPFAYRIEVRGVESHEDRVRLVGDIAGRLDHTVLLNSPSSYDVELRVEIAAGKCSLYLKLFSCADTRFSYRAQDVPASIAPSAAAALILRLHGRLSGDARVLDPFCGSGTLLFERALAMPCRSLTGVDITGQAVEAAKANALQGGFRAAFIRADILLFRNRHTFEEIWANMPFGGRCLSHPANVRLYKSFIGKLPSLLSDGAFAALLTMEKRLLHESVAQVSALELVSEAPVATGRLVPSLFVLQKKS